MRLNSDDLVSSGIVVVIRGWSALIPLVTGETLMVPTCMGPSREGKRLVEEGDRLGLYSSVLSHGGCEG